MWNFRTYQRNACLSYNYFVSSFGEISSDFFSSKCHLVTSLGVYPRLVGLPLRIHLRFCAYFISLFAISRNCQL